MKRSRFTFVIASVLFAFGIVAAFLFLIVQGNRHDRVLMEYHASQALNEMIDLFVQAEGTPERSTIEPSPGVLGFGVYDSEGREQFTVGDRDALSPRPQEIDTLFGNTGPRGNLGNEIASHDGDRVRVVRRSGAGFGGDRTTTPRGRSPRSGSGSGSGSGNAGPRYWVIEYTARSVVADRRSRLTFVALLFLMILGLAGFVLFLGRSLRRIEENARRNRSLAQLGGAARTIAHEIKNPLSAIRLQTSLLKRITKETDAGRAPLEAIDEEVDRIANLADSVRSFLTNPLGTPIEIDAVQEIQAIISRRSFPITFGGDRSPAPIYMDRLRFHSVIANLCLNAHQAMATANEKDEADEADEADIKVPPVEVAVATVSSRSGDNDSVQISVSDRGPGIPKEIRANVFDPFFTTRRNGTGIGLATVQTFVTAAGGSVAIEDRRGGGTVITVGIPLSRKEQE